MGGGSAHSLANRLTIGFAIAFAVLTGLAVIGVARFLQQRQDFEDATARSYETEIVARNHLAEGRNPRAARATVDRRAGEALESCAATSTARPATRRCSSAPG